MTADEIAGPRATDGEGEEVRSREQPVEGDDADITEPDGEETAPPLSDDQRTLAATAVPLIDGLARHVHRTYGGVLGPAELASAGRAALPAIAQSFDPKLGVPFAIYASFRVRCAMLDAMRAERAELRRRVMLACNAGYDFASCQQAPKPGWYDQEEDAREQLQSFAGGIFTSMFAAAVGGDPPPIGEDGAIVRESYAEAMAALATATAQLTQRDRKIVTMHYHERRALTDVARTLRVSYASVRRYHHAAVEKLRVKLEALGVSSVPMLVEEGG